MWIVYENLTQKRYWSLRNKHPKQQLKMNIHAKIAVFCVWRNHKDNICYELISSNQTINCNVYCRQMAILKPKKNQRTEVRNYHQVVSQQNNARPHMFWAIRIIYRVLIWISYPPTHIVLFLLHPTPTYSLSKRNSLQGKTFTDLNRSEIPLDNIFHQNQSNHMLIWNI